jgi:predicted nucleic acid-binding protein
MTVLIDTSVLLAAAMEKDTRHAEAKRTLIDFAFELQVVVVPVLNELFQIVAFRTHYGYAIEKLDDSRQAFHVESLISVDMDVMLAIMRRYKSSEFDFADVAIMAVAE